MGLLIEKSTSLLSDIEALELPVAVSLAPGAAEACSLLCEGIFGAGILSFGPTSFWRLAVVVAVAAMLCAISRSSSDAAGCRSSCFCNSVIDSRSSYTVVSGSGWCDRLGGWP